MNGLVATLETRHLGYVDSLKQMRCRDEVQVVKRSRIGAADCATLAELGAQLGGGNLVLVTLRVTADSRTLLGFERHVAGMAVMEQNGSEAAA